MKQFVFSFLFLLTFGATGIGHSQTSCNSAAGQSFLGEARVVIGTPINMYGANPNNILVSFISEFFKETQNVSMGNDCYSNEKWIMYYSTNVGRIGSLPSLAAIRNDFTLSEGIFVDTCLINRAGNTANGLTYMKCSNLNLTGPNPAVYYRIARRFIIAGASYQTRWSPEYTYQVPNSSPTANAGTSKYIYLPTSTVSLPGTGTDVDGAVRFNWSKKSGPVGGNLLSPSAATTTVSGLQQGIYQFELKVTDNAGVTASSLVNITVQANQRPTANAGTDITRKLPNVSAILTGSGTDPTGVSISFRWAQISGPASGLIESPSALISSIKNLGIAGDYTYQLTVTDDGGLTATDQIVVHVLANTPPTAIAGADINFAAPGFITITGSGTDDGGIVQSFSWSKLHKNPGGDIESPTSATTRITNLNVPGDYAYLLTVVDNGGLSGSDEVVVHVGSIAPPTANAGVDKTVKESPSFRLEGIGTPANGNTITSYSWRKISGPATGAIDRPTEASTLVKVASGLLPVGDYAFELTVTDNMGRTATDNVIVHVVTNTKPVAIAFVSPSAIKSPGTVTLNGSFSRDPDGTIRDYIWRRVSGPIGNDVIVSPNAVSTEVTGLVTLGTYVYSLQVRDNFGDFSNRESVSVKVVRNVAHVASAGNDVTIRLPLNTVQLTGTAIGSLDGENPILYKSWTCVALPANKNPITISNPQDLTTSITGLQIGTYTFRFSAGDGITADAFDDVLVTVLPQ